ncbi:aminotransferase class V-fold PLP-dependent enzyme [Ruania zhangjianzhongii]|uniref:aminotransferase class V-fold PLP-dependent enzyme n=1 Tax=Ruania zhangjianzhongii TaxID=2603206 RepID=UPI0011CC32BF|nr:aminotransferase class V-fold PLP-dependent enzyme [Ruania zhangjianzhongii]
MTATPADATTGPFLRDEVEGIDEMAYFYTGAEGPPLRSQRAAALRYLDDKADGEAGRQRAEAELDRVRELTAAMLSGRSDAVAALGNTSDALYRLVRTMRFAPGDNVITSDIEFPSGVLTLLALREQGVQVRIVRSRDGAVSPEDVADQVDERTRLIIASHVSYVTGARIDAPAIAALARRNGAAFILDVTQSLGVIRVDADDADAIVCSTYKWLLGPHGMGLLHLTRPEAFSDRLDGAGWRSVTDVFAPDRLEAIHAHPDARRFELGFPSFPSAYLLAEAMDTLRTVDAAAMERHAMAVSEALLDGLLRQGYTLLTPREQDRRGTNISVAVDGGAHLAEQLFRSGVRAWGGDGRLRFSVHGFNTHAEVETTLRALRHGGSS